MNLYLLSQTVERGYDSFDSFVCAAETPLEPRSTHPRGGPLHAPARSWGAWASSPDDVTCVFIGRAAPGTKAGPVCASFNAG